MTWLFLALGTGWMVIEALLWMRRLKPQLLIDRACAEDRAESLGRMLGVPSHGRELDGLLGGAHVELRIGADGQERPSWAGAVRGAPRHTSFRAGRGTATGDPDFDDHVLLTTDLPGLSAGVRRQILHAVQAGTTMTDGTAFTQGVAASLSEIEDVLRNVAAAVHGLKTETATPRTLAESDPVPAVRARALRRIPPPRDDAWWLARTCDADPEVAVVAADLLGHPGRLLELAGGPAGGSALTALLAHEVTPSPALDAALARWLAVRPEHELITLAARAGTVALVPILAAIDGRRSRDAIRAIQARTHGERGALSEVGGEGWLSPAAEPTTPESSDRRVR